MFLRYVRCRCSRGRSEPRCQDVRREFERWASHTPLEPVFIIDRDVKRRASTSYYLNSQGISAEPFETIAEFVGRWPKTGIVLIHDDETDVALLVREIGRRQGWLPVLAFSPNPEPSRIVQAVMDGAVGFAGWPGCERTLLQTIRSAGTRYQSAHAPNSRKALARGRIEMLSKREREILAGMVEGLSNRQIGTHLSISPRTVELHRANLIAKIGVRRSAEAIRLAIEASLAV
jgi:two-component system response regulator FixJ